jgi:hypothetical protein
LDILAQGTLGPTLKILDFGVGAGHALLPSLKRLLSSSSFSQNKTTVQLTLVEPSATMLAKTTCALEKLNEEFPYISFETFEGTLQDYIHKGVEERWDVVQTSFCFHYVPRKERHEVLNWIAQHATTFCMYEFDVPILPFASPEAATSLKGRYEKGTRREINSNEK